MAKHSRRCELELSGLTAQAGPSLKMMPAAAAGFNNFRTSTFSGNLVIGGGANDVLGGDGSGDSNGRYRFVNNTILLGPGPGGGAFRLFSGLESIEMHNNAIAREGGGPVRVVVETTQCQSGR